VRGAMADELAARLVDTGHFRVLPREWFPHQSDEVPSLDVLRAAAKFVNVDYLVFGSIQQSTGMSVQQRRTVSTLFVTLRVMDVGSADVVGTATAHWTFATPNGSRPPLVALPIISRSPLLAAVAIAKIATARSHSSSTRLSKDWRHVIQQ